jgi:hypothetical protein
MRRTGRHTPKPVRPLVQDSNPNPSTVKGFMLASAVQGVVASVLDAAVKLGCAKRNKLEEAAHPPCSLGLQVSAPVAELALKGRAAVPGRPRQPSILRCIQCARSSVALELVCGAHEQSVGRAHPSAGRPRGWLPSSCALSAVARKCARQRSAVDP